MLKAGILQNLEKLKEDERTASLFTIIGTVDRKEGLSVALSERVNHMMSSFGCSWDRRSLTAQRAESGEISQDGYVYPYNLLLPVEPPYFDIEPTTLRNRSEERTNPETVNRGALVHTERKLKESLTDSYRICSTLAVIENDVIAMLDEARDTIEDPATEECIAEAVYYYQAEITAEATAARLLAPEPVMCRFQRIVKRPQRWDKHVPDLAKDVDYEGQTVGNWIEDLLALADGVEEQCEVIADSVAQIIDVEENLQHYLDTDDTVIPLMRAYIESVSENEL